MDLAQRIAEALKNLDDRELRLIWFFVRRFL